MLRGPRNYEPLPSYRQGKLVGKVRKREEKSNTLAAFCEKIDSFANIAKEEAGVEAVHDFSFILCDIKQFFKLVSISSDSIEESELLKGAFVLLCNFDDLLNLIMCVH